MYADTEALIRCVVGVRAERWAQTEVSMDYDVYRQHCNLQWEQSAGGTQSGEVEVSSIEKMSES